MYGANRYNAMANTLESELCKKSPGVAWDVMRADEAVRFLSWEHAGIAPDALVVTVEITVQGKRARVRNQASTHLLESMRDYHGFVDHFVREVAHKFGFAIFGISEDEPAGD